MLRLDAAHEPVVIIFALAATNDFAVALRRQQVITENGPRIGRILLHVERLGFARIVEDEYRAIVLLYHPALIFRAKVVTPLDRAAVVLQHRDGIGVVHPGKGRDDTLQGGGIALELRELGLAAL